MKDKIFGVLQRIGRSFMLPIAILPVAGLLLGIGSSLTNATTIEDISSGRNPWRRNSAERIIHDYDKSGKCDF